MRCVIDLWVARQLSIIWVFGMFCTESVCCINIQQILTWPSCHTENAFWQTRAITLLASINTNCLTLQEHIHLFFFFYSICILLTRDVGLRKSRQFRLWSDPRWFADDLFVLVLKYHSTGLQAKQCTSRSVLSMNFNWRYFHNNYIDLMHWIHVSSYPCAFVQQRTFL